MVARFDSGRQIVVTMFHPSFTTRVASRHASDQGMRLAAAGRLLPVVEVANCCSGPLVFLFSFFFGIKEFVNCVQIRMWVRSLRKG